MLDSEWFQMNGRADTYKRLLQAVLLTEKGYIIHTFHSHEHSTADIYGAHLSTFKIAIPCHFTNLTMMTAIYYHINFFRLGELIEQTLTQKVVFYQKGVSDGV